MSDPATVVAANQAPRKPGTRAAAAHGRKLLSITGGRYGILATALERVSTVQSASADGHWVIRTSGLRRSASVDLSALWLSISLPLRRQSGPLSLGIIGSMLSRNGRVAASVRIVGQRRQGGREVVADIPADLLLWDDESEFRRVLGSTIAGLDTALATNPQCCDSPSPTGSPREQVEANFDEAGWPSQPGEGDRLEVPLDVPGNYFVANVEHGGPSASLTVPILAAELGAAPAVCRNAVAVLLWLTASRVRMVKPTRSRRALALEVSLLPGHCKPIGFAHACAALSVALQQCAAEAALLVADEDLARLYLSNLGFQLRHEVSAPRADVHPLADDSSKGVCL